ncbi:hypothetical protein HU200_000468 [Digitaria exilis]|uniref:Uncharacterized protein n=1 Tax=Digitaria exilis TaxID=1010633 RepID=A0A835KVL8_9POAL|nr:hypothetical protein HU200_000468 [Digitaria exilis]
MRSQGLQTREARKRSLGSSGGTRRRISATASPLSSGGAHGGAMACWWLDRRGFGCGGLRLREVGDGGAIRVRRTVSAHRQTGSVLVLARKRLGCFALSFYFVYYRSDPSIVKLLFFYN